MQFNKEKIKSLSLILSWALYDLANQFFALNIVSFYFVAWLTLEKKIPEIFYGISFSISIFFVAVLGLIFGVASDAIGRRRPFLVFFTLLSIIFTMVLGVGSNVFLSLLFFAIANFGCQIAIIFYNALMVNIAPKNRVGLVSGIGKMLGYTGALLALFLTKPIVLKHGYQATFLPTGVLFLIFSLPCLIFIKDKEPKGKINLKNLFKKDNLIGAFNSLRKTAFESYRFTGLLDFLKAGFFGLCAVNAIILFMAVYASRVFGLDKAGLINLIFFSTVFGIGGCLFFGFFSDYIGYKLSMMIVFTLWIISFLLAAFVENSQLFWLIGALVGIALGSTWVVSRALAVRLVPEEKMGEVFSLFNFIGYLSAIVGALFFSSIVSVLSFIGKSSYRIAVLSLILFMVLGFVFLLRLPDKKIAFGDKTLP